MKSIHRVIGGLLAVAALVVVVIAYSAHVVRSSDHQDTYNLATRSNTSADITDVYVFPSPANSANVVFVMNVSPLIPAGMGTAKFFDPTLMWQFKISHGTSGVEDEVIQLGVSGTNAAQVVSLYGPAKPNEVGTTNTFVPVTGTVGYNSSATLSNGVQVFAGPRADPFFFDLFAFFSFLGDRNFSTHSSQTDPGTGQHADQRQQRRRGRELRDRRQQDRESEHTLVRRLPGRNAVGPRRVRLPHRPAAERPRRHRGRLQRPLVCRRSSAHIAHLGLLEPGSSRMGDGQLVDRFIGAHDEIQHSDSGHRRARPRARGVQRQQQRGGQQSRQHHTGHHGRKIHPDRTALASGGERAVRKIRRPSNDERRRAVRRLDAAG